MMEENEIPTAENFWLSKRPLLSHAQIAIEFAKIHVKAALESAYINQIVEDERVAYSLDPEYRATRESILNSYPETNIK